MCLIYSDCCGNHSRKRIILELTHMKATKNKKHLKLDCLKKEAEEKVWRKIKEEEAQKQLSDHFISMWTVEINKKSTKVEYVLVFIPNMLNLKPSEWKVD
ncbi:hypothetical protein DITRI_Ditri02bG0017400 [Diplodiscus trichospermus]